MNEPQQTNSDGIGLPPVRPKPSESATPGEPVPEVKGRARNILRGRSCEVTAILRLPEDLKNERAFGDARKLLALARKQNVQDPALRLKLAQQHALCTYRDPDLPAGSG
jgi:hypothetical protein